MARRSQTSRPKAKHTIGSSGFKSPADLYGYLGRQTSTRETAEEGAYAVLVPYTNPTCSSGRRLELQESLQTRHGRVHVKLRSCKALTMVAKVCFEQSSLS